MEGQTKVIRLLENGGEIIRDFLKDCTTFRVVNGEKVNVFPLALLDYMKEHDFVEIKHVGGMYSVYKRKLPKQSEVRIAAGK